MEDKIKYVKAELEKRRGQWTDIAHDAGIGRRTINCIVNDEHEPQKSTIDCLWRHLKKLEKSGK